MANRRQKQAVDDIVKCVNSANDVIDVAAFILHEIDPTNGTQLYKEGTTEYTVPELIGLAKIRLQQAITFETLLKNFVQTFGLANVSALVSALGYDATELRDDILDIGDEARYVLGVIDAATTKAELSALGDHINTEIPMLVLVRRWWAFD